VRDRALFDLAIDSKLSGCDVAKIRIGDLVSGGRVRARATVVQQKSGRPVQFELPEAARNSIQAWLEHRGGTIDDYAFPSRNNRAWHISTRQYARLVDEWVTAIVLRCEDCGTLSLRRTKAWIIHKSDRQLAGSAVAPGPYENREYGAAISEWTSKTRSPLMSTLRYERRRPRGEDS
jgi:integrase